jgi:hypothetical protein
VGWEINLYLPQTLRMLKEDLFPTTIGHVCLALGEMLMCLFHATERSHGNTASHLSHRSLRPEVGAQASTARVLTADPSYCPHLLSPQGEVRLQVGSPPLTRGSESAPTPWSSPPCSWENLHKGLASSPVRGWLSLETGILYHFSQGL